MTALESPACLAVGLMCCVNHLPANLAAKKMKKCCNQLPLDSSRNACFREWSGCNPAKNVFWFSSCSWFLCDYICFIGCDLIEITGSSDRSWMVMFFRLWRIGPRGFLAPLGVVSTSTLSELLWDFLWAVRYSGLQGNKVNLMFTLLSGGQRQRAGNRTKDWDYKLQVSDNIT